jgi:glycerophosphoryl diester phosphodiesterase
LALEHGAGYVEQDLQITRDGVLVCLHDETLERTTNVEQVFPRRARIENGVRKWYVWDFDISEIRRLEAGSWFASSFKTERIPTFDEALELIGTKAGIYPETKSPQVYGSKGRDMERLLAETLRKHSIWNVPHRATVQSFSHESLEKLKGMGCTLPLVLLVGAERKERWLTEAGLKTAKKFAFGIAPNKSLVREDASLVARAHALGLTVTPWTFRQGTDLTYASVREEMRHYLNDLGVDALFTDNPEQFPRD